MGYVYREPYLSKWDFYILKLLMSEMSLCGDNG